MSESLPRSRFMSGFSQSFFWMRLLLFISALTLSFSGRVVFKLRSNNDSHLLSRYNCDSIARMPGLEITRPGSSPRPYYACERKSSSISDKHIVGLAKNDPRILKVFVDAQTAISTAFTTNDPDYWQQTLYFGPQKGESGETVYFQNFPRLWDQGINGTGIAISVVDAGADLNHVELKENYDLKLSYNFVENNKNPHTVSDEHGTACIGLISSKRGNGRCGVGAAFEARIGVIRVFGGPVPSVCDSTIAQALKYAYEHTHMYSISWGPGNDGKTVDKPLSLVVESMEFGGKYGRYGRGTMYIFPTGNGGPSDHCGYNHYIQGYESFSFSSMNRAGKKTWMGERCSAVLASCISDSRSGENSKLFTTWPNDKCEKSFSGTSACPPLAAAAIAGLLQKFLDLTMRDVMDIIIRSSLQTDISATVNTAGLAFSGDFGFGLFQPDKMVELATNPNYQRLSPPRTCMTPIYIPNYECDGRCVIHSSMFISGCFGLTAALDTVEVVIVKISVKSTVRGSLNVVLTSPTGTRVALLEPRPLDISNEGLTDWSIKSLATYDERSYGYWKLDIDVPHGVKTTLVSWGLKLHGRVQSADSSNQHDLTKKVICKEGYDDYEKDHRDLCAGKLSKAKPDYEDSFTYINTNVEVIKERRQTWCETSVLGRLPMVGVFTGLLVRFGIC